MRQNRFVSLGMLLSLTCLIGWLVGCEPDQQTRTNTSNQSTDPAFEQAFTVISSSCMPCHNRNSLPQVIARARQADFKEIAGDTKPRILGELEELQEAMKAGTPFSFTSREEMLKFFEAAPGELYTMVEKGVMPPPWAVPLMKQIQWPYVPLTPAKRVLILQFAKPYSEKYL